MSFWRWYFFKDWSRNPLWFWLTFTFWAIVMIEIVRRTEAFRPFLSLLEGPFAVAGLLIFLASVLDLSYMEYKVDQCQPPHEMTPPLGLMGKIAHSTVWGFKKQWAIPQQYRQFFGTDFFYWFYRGRLISVLCWSIAFIRFTQVST
jgi:hypothetical protein